MSSSSTPEPPEPHLDLEDIKADETEVEHEHERALGVAKAARREKGGGWVTFAWAAPGFIWLGFFLIAPLVFIVLMSFWTPNTATGCRCATDNRPTQDRPASTRSRDRRRG